MMPRPTAATSTWPNGWDKSQAVQSWAAASPLSPPLAAWPRAKSNADRARAPYVAPMNA